MTLILGDMDSAAIEQPTSPSAPAEGAAPPATARRAAAAAPFTASAGSLVTGLILLFVAQGAWLVGQQQAVVALGDLYAAESPGLLMMIVAGVLGVAGLIFAIVGAHQLATHVDNLAREQRGLPLR